MLTVSNVYGLLSLRTSPRPKPSCNSTLKK
ncbi:hypothetical protein GCK32_022645 [Trichostrongylus colubriformis]|uniref:Uncharacterized protein n=1 Tax=Trichostrongylus colubriformis TaxID=6319 RepID=A0AAN8IXB4_TRICO